MVGAVCQRALADAGKTPTRSIMGPCAQKRRMRRSPVAEDEEVGADTSEATAVAGCVAMCLGGRRRHGRVRPWRGVSAVHSLRRVSTWVDRRCIVLWEPQSSCGGRARYPRLGAERGGRGKMVRVPENSGRSRAPPFHAMREPLTLPARPLPGSQRTWIVRDRPGASLTPGVAR
jgi:hypothetical protein